MPLLMGFLAKSALMMSPFGSAIYAIGRGVKAIAKALNWQGWIGLVAAVALGWLWLNAASDARHWHKQSDRFQQLYERERDGRKADRQAYQQAQKDAAAKNLADIQRNEQRQKEISDARIKSLNARLERITRELRDNPAAKGSAGRAPIPETGPAPCRAYDPAWLCLSPADRLRAAENEERHDQLITWAEQQSQVNPNELREPPR